MFLGPGQVTAVIAVALFVLAAIIRYCDFALRSVPNSLIDMAEMSGASQSQQLTLIRFPFAIPGLLLGLNQVVMLGIGMVVVTALIGTQGLEEETVIAIAKVDPGRGLVAGLIVSLIAIIADRFLTACAANRSSQVSK